MQQLLPEVDMTDKIVWNGNEFGHSGNWNDENVRFCLDTIINLMVRLQGAHPRPQPKKFYDVFRHVLTVKVERPLVTGAQEVNFPGADHPVVILGAGVKLNIGDTIEGEISACNEHGGWPRTADDIDKAEWLKVTSPTWKDWESRSDQMLIVRREDVDISIEEIPERGDD